MSMFSRMKSGRLGRLATGSVAAAVFGVALLGTVVVAQTQQPAAIEWDKRRLDRLDRNVRRLERALTQRNAAGDPVLLEPDPEVIALEGRVAILDRRLEDLEATVQRVNADLERLTFALDESERTNAALARTLASVGDRLDALESAAAEAAPAAPSSPTGDPDTDFTAAMRLMNEGDFAAARRAFETFVVTWPDADQTPEAQFRLGETRFIAEDNAGAVQAYAAALRGWPRARWAGEAVIKLATALEADGRAEQACQALGEFERRYAEGAAAALRARAAQAGVRADCR